MASVTPHNVTSHNVTPHSVTSNSCLFPFPPRRDPVRVRLTGLVDEGAGVGAESSWGVRYELYMYPQVPAGIDTEEGSDGRGIPPPEEASMTLGERNTPLSMGGLRAQGEAIEMHLNLNAVLRILKHLWLDLMWHPHLAQPCIARPSPSHSHHLGSAGRDGGHTVDRNRDWGGGSGGEGEDLSPGQVLGRASGDPCVPLKGDPGTPGELLEHDDELRGASLNETAAGRSRFNLRMSSDNIVVTRTTGHHR